MNVKGEVKIPDALYDEEVKVVTFGNPRNGEDGLWVCEICALSLEKSKKWQASVVERYAKLEKAAQTVGKGAEESGDAAVIGSLGQLIAELPGHFIDLVYTYIGELDVDGRKGELRDAETGKTNVTVETAQRKLNAAVERREWMERNATKPQLWKALMAIVQLEFPFVQGLSGVMEVVNAMKMAAGQARTVTGTRGGGGKGGK